LSSDEANCSHPIRVKEDSPFSFFSLPIIHSGNEIDKTLLDAMRIVRWQPYMSFHQSYMWSHVEELIDAPILYVLNSDSIPLRRTLGWRPFDSDEINAIMLTRNKLRGGIKIINEHLESVHIFHSIWGVRVYFFLILYALLRGVRVAITQEPYSESPFGYQKAETKLMSKLRTRIRPMAYKRAARIFSLLSRDKRPCMLAISHLAERQLLNNGFASDTLYPFAYFIPQSNAETHITQVEDDGRLRLIFVGAMLPIKGIDIAIEAMRRIDHLEFPISLDCYGAGPLTDLFETAPSNVKYKGLLAPENVQRTIANYDCLILPSRHDGWGVVVNEALLQGVPVIVSDRVGSGSLIQSSGAGIIFNSEDSCSLERKIIEIYLDKDGGGRIFRRAHEFDKSSILPSTGAHYMVSVLDHYFNHSGKRPEAPWL